jgi:hypothetical protein
MEENGMTMTLEQLCVRYTTAHKESLDLTAENREVPDQYKSISSTIAKAIKPKLDRLSTVSVPYITNAFVDNEAAIERKMNAIGKTIPVSIPQYLASELYATNFNELDAQNQRIIKLLSMYICISI